MLAGTRLIKRTALRMALAAGVTALALALNQGTALAGIPQGGGQFAAPGLTPVSGLPQFLFKTQSPGSQAFSSIQDVAIDQAAGVAHVVGQFNTVVMSDGTQVARDHYAQLDLDTMRILPPHVEFRNSRGEVYVEAVAAANGRVYLGGDFDQITAGRTTRNVAHLAAIEASNGALDQSFGAGIVGHWDQVRTLALVPAGNRLQVTHDRRALNLWVGGDISEIGYTTPGGLRFRQAASGIAIFDSATGKLAGNAPRLNGDGRRANTIELESPNRNGRPVVIVGGAFSGVNGVRRMNAAQFTTDGAPTSWRLDYDDSVNAVLTGFDDSTNVLLGGHFEHVRPRLAPGQPAEWHVPFVSGATASGGMTPWTIWGTPPSATARHVYASAVFALEQTSRAVIVGGALPYASDRPGFGSYESVAAHDFATGKLKPWRTGLPTARTPGTLSSAVVNSLGYYCRTGLLVAGGGSFLRFNNEPAGGLAVWRDAQVRDHCS